MNVNLTGRNMPNLYGGDAPAPAGPGSSTSSREQAARGASSASAPGPGAGSRHDREALRIIDIFEEIRENFYLLNRNRPASASYTDYQIRFSSDCVAYTMLTCEERRIFDRLIAPRSEHLSEVVANVKSLEELAAHDAAAPSASGPPASAAAHAVREGDTASRAATEARPVARTRLNLDPSLQRNPLPPLVIDHASRHPRQHFQAPPVAPFQIQRPPQVAMQASSGDAGNSHHWSCFPASCPSVPPSVKMGVGIGAVVGISVGGFMMFKQLI